MLEASYGTGAMLGALLASFGLGGAVSLLVLILVIVIIVAVILRVLGR